MSGTANPSSKLPELTPVILAGGAGTRLRPVTSAARPKPFVKFFSRNSLLQDTLMRVKYLGNPVIVCAAAFAERVFQECYEIGVEPRAIVCEPAQRSTAAAIAAAALVLKDDGRKMLVMPSDHYVRDAQALRDAIGKAAGVAEDFALIGAKPGDASGRYGYIQYDGNWKLVRFIEKPDMATARALVGSGRALWNTGMFVCAPAVFLSKLEKGRPDVYKGIKAAVEGGRREMPFLFPGFDDYAALPSVAVDYAVMEKLDTAAVVPLVTTWHDMGTLSSFLFTKLFS